MRCQPALPGAVATISLIAGGIGMNIMLVSVTERVREIGCAWRSTPGPATCAAGSWPRRCCSRSAAA